MNKLTKAQLRELRELAAAGSRVHYVDHYSPIAALLALGLVDREQGKYGSSSYAITPAGRAQLAEHSHG